MRARAWAWVSRFRVRLKVRGPSESLKVRGPSESLKVRVQGLGDLGYVDVMGAHEARDFGHTVGAIHGLPLVLGDAVQHGLARRGQVCEGPPLVHPPKGHPYVIGNVFLHHLTRLIIEDHNVVPVDAPDMGLDLAIDRPEGASILGTKAAQSLLHSRGTAAWLAAAARLPLLGARVQLLGSAHLRDPCRGCSEAGCRAEKSATALAGKGG